MNASWTLPKSTKKCRICQRTTFIRAESGTEGTGTFIAITRELGWADASMRCARGVEGVARLEQEPRITTGRQLRLLPVAGPARR